MNEADRSRKEWSSYKETYPIRDLRSSGGFALPSFTWWWWKQAEVDERKKGRWKRRKRRGGGNSLPPSICVALSQALHTLCYCTQELWTSQERKHIEKNKKKELVWGYMIKLEKYFSVHSSRLLIFCPLALFNFKGNAWNPNVIGDDLCKGKPEKEILWIQKCQHLI